MGSFDPKRGDKLEPDMLPVWNPEPTVETSAAIRQAAALERIAAALERLAEKVTP